MSTVAAAPPHSPRRGEPAWDVAYLFPRQGEWTEEEYLALDARRLIELSEGCLDVLPVPSPFHQAVVRFLLALLHEFVSTRGLGEAFGAPLPVRLWAGKMREPDVLFVRHERLVNRRQPPQGADLVIEVVSEGEENRERDLVTKRAEYAKAGVAEYWIVDPQQRSITVLALAETGGYRVHGVFAIGAKATSALLPGLSVDVAAAFAAGEGTARVL